MRRLVLLTPAAESASACDNEVVGATSRVVVGRERELERLDAALDVVATAGAPGFATVAGEAGVGKSRLVTELGGRGQERGFQVLVGRCVDRGEEVRPLAAIRDVVGTLSDRLDSEALDLVMGGARGVLAPLVPDLGAVPADGDPVPLDGLCELLVALVRRLARRQPLLLVVEDLHWADATTRAVFGALARSAHLGPTLLVGTYRSDELHRRHPLRPLLGELARVPGERVELTPFDRATTAELVAAIGTVDLADVALADVHRRTGGNPFLVEEVVAAAAAGHAGVPDSLRDVLLARAATLDDVALDVLDSVAVAGAAENEVLADVTGHDPLAVAEATHRLLRRALLVPDGEDVRFRHELGREVFDAELLPGARAGLHRRLAASLERRRPERPGEIARHWWAGREPERAFGPSVAAGRLLATAGAAAEAAGHFARALEGWGAIDDPDGRAGTDHAGLLAETASALFHAGDLTRAVELYRAAADELRGVDVEREAWVWVALGQGVRFLGRREESDEVVRRLLELVPASPPSRLRVTVLADAAIAALVAGRGADGLGLATDAVAVAEALGDVEAIVEASNALLAAFEVGGDAEPAMALAPVNLARAERAGLTGRTLIFAHYRYAGVLLSRGHYDEAADAAERGIAVARGTGLGGPVASWLAELWVEALYFRGRWAEVEGVAAEVADLLDHPARREWRGTSVAHMLVQQGRLEEARPLVDDARRAFAGDWVELGAVLGRLIVLFDAAEGHHDRIPGVVEEVMARTERGQVEEDLVAAAIALHVDGLVSRPSIDVDAAATLYRRWVAWLDRPRPDGWRDVTPALMRATAVAHAGRLDHSTRAEDWHDVAAGWAGVGARYEEAEARFHEAAAHLAGVAGRTPVARRAANDALVPARAAAVELGAVPLRARIDELARRARLPIAEGPASGDAMPGGDDLGLTEREHEVLALLVAGRTNGQIAAALFISTKTASVHVSNILRKLGVANRVEAAAVGARSLVGQRAP